MSTAIELPGLSETQRQIIELAREFARTKIEPFAAEWDRRAAFSPRVVDEPRPPRGLRLCAPPGGEGGGAVTGPPPPSPGGGAPPGAEGAGGALDPQAHSST